MLRLGSARTVYNTYQLLFLGLRNMHKITSTSSRLCGGSVTRLTGRREYVRVGLTAAIPAADTCQSSHRVPAIPNLGIKKGLGCAWRGCRQQGRFLLLQNLHSRHPWRSSCRQAPWMGLRRSSTGIPHTLRSAKRLKLGIADRTPFQQLSNLFHARS